MSRSARASEWLGPNDALGSVIGPSCTCHSCRRVSTRSFARFGEACTPPSSDHTRRRELGTCRTPPSSGKARRRELGSTVLPARTPPSSGKARRREPTRTPPSSDKARRRELGSTVLPARTAPSSDQVRRHESCNESTISKRGIQLSRTTEEQQQCIRPKAQNRIPIAVTSAVRNSSIPLFLSFPKAGTPHSGDDRQGSTEARPEVPSVARIEESREPVGPCREKNESRQDQVDCHEKLTASVGPHPRPTGSDMVGEQLANVSAEANMERGAVAKLTGEAEEPFREIQSENQAALEGAKGTNAIAKETSPECTAHRRASLQSQMQVTKAAADATRKAVRDLQVAQARMKELQRGAERAISKRPTNAEAPAACTSADTQEEWRLGTRRHGCKLTSRWPALDAGARCVCSSCECKGVMVKTCEVRVVWGAHMM